MSDLEQCLIKLKNAAPVYESREFVVLDNGQDNPKKPVLSVYFTCYEENYNFCSEMQAKETVALSKKEYSQEDIENGYFDDMSYEDFICTKIKKKEGELEIINSDFFEDEEKYHLVCIPIFWNEICTNKYICQIIIAEPKENSYVEHRFFFDGTNADRVQGFSYRRGSDEMTNSPLYQFLYFIHVDVFNEQYIWTFVRNKEMHPYNVEIMENAG